MFNLFIELFSWRSVLDILLLSLGLYFIYKTLNRLGAWKILVGIFVAIGIYLVAFWFELEGIIWVYDNLSQVAVMGLVVLFQPEIRKLFEVLVTSGRRKIKKPESNLSSQIADVVDTLARQKRGALIVLPGKETVNTHLSGGEIVNAEFSKHLILSIFDPHSPGHDGAIVIEEGKITRFGVRLPISANEKLSNDYGTRHYAAAGLSEVTDAIVIAVSEERGVATVFEHGKGKIKDTIAGTKQIIDEHWEIVQSFLPALPESKNTFTWLEIAISLMVASVFWYSIVIGEAEIHEKVVALPIEYIGTPKDMMLGGDKPLEVKAHLVGPKSSLVSSSDLRVRIDLSLAKAGKQWVTITSDNINLLKKVKLVDVKPSRLSLELVHLVEKDIVIKPQFTGSLAPSLRLISVEVHPDKIKGLVASTSTGNRVLVINTAPVNMDMIKTSTNITSKIIAPPTFQPLEKKWPDVEIRIKVEQKRARAGS